MSNYLTEVRNITKAPSFPTVTVSKRKRYRKDPNIKLFFMKVIERKGIYFMSRESFNQYESEFKSANLEFRDVLAEKSILIVKNTKNIIVFKKY